ncbi:hypothetical protein BpHYR1_009016 [Brachionus plicatilis]|uniref:Uncharacterized protein n=1 Tax=Brachionus plicatilis TaxID=10195 RepID=A0A3M7QEG9_BRAPC|nr:hypothetical protein BpHYR1_009016 [Brachionus plicatilis]
MFIKKLFLPKLNSNSAFRKEHLIANELRKPGERPRLVIEFIQSWTKFDIYQLFDFSIFQL